MGGRRHNWLGDLSTHPRRSDTTLSLCKLSFVGDTTRGDGKEKGEGEMNIRLSLLNLCVKMSLEEECAGAYVIE